MLDHDFTGRAWSIIVIVDDWGDHVEARWGKARSVEEERIVAPLVHVRDVPDVANRIPDLAQSTHALSTRDLPEVNVLDDVSNKGDQIAIHWREEYKALRPGPNNWPR